ncbi:SRPBCC domain-containing protein [Aminobacter anthyllidis]|uniref:SRPBCC domain-containing protein n=1 Tax=Aminobacter anthyllidis TaxID=1035067 RepID=A0A9X1D769_9HYPH|nr:SRPBCC domain-containing protein [Aminobacter anthyllidis]MBT1157564.1 SRPBCC domain-containing protein [Aminobacter anthyllidis]
MDADKVFKALGDPTRSRLLDLLCEKNGPTLGEPCRRAAFTWADPSEAASPASYSRVTFDIEEYDTMVRLTVTHDELEAGSGMANGISKGWPIVLSSLKSFLETGRAIDVFAKPKSA